MRASRMRECVLANASALRGWLPPRRAQQRVRNPRLRIAVSVTRQRSLSVWYEPCRGVDVSCSSWPCSIASIHFPVSLSFAPHTAIVERCVRVCASVGCAHCINIPYGWCQGRTRRGNSGHMSYVVIHVPCCLYTKRVASERLCYDKMDIYE